MTERLDSHRRLSFQRAATLCRSVRCLCVVLSVALLAGCFQSYGVPDQTQFASLLEAADLDQAHVRVYGAPIPFLERIAFHTWVVTKRAGERRYHRWEIWLCPEGDFDQVCVDSLTPDSGIGSEFTFVLGEKIGADAETIVAFVQNESPNYPFRHIYIPFPGPNSNTFTQWILDKSGWGLKLQPVALGADWNPPQGWPAVDGDKD